MRTLDTRTIEWTIVGVHNEACDVRTLTMKSSDGIPPFIAGQYLTVMLPGHLPVEGKSYSISSTPEMDHMDITVKRMGAFSEALYKKEVGDTLVTSRPYGFFYPEPPYPETLIFLAGGIGITPIVSIIETLLTQGYPGNIALFYSNQTLENIAFKERLTALASEYYRFSVHHFITRETPENSSYVARRMTPSFIAEHVPSFTVADYFVCGSLSFTRGLWHALRDAGIDTKHIFTEGFF